MYKVMKSFICRGCVNPVTGTGRTSVDIGGGGNANLELVDKFCYVGDMLSVDGDADAAVKDISLTVRGRLYSSCVRSSILHGSETWPVRKENDVALQRAEMRMVRWMCGVKLQDRVSSKELRGRLELEDIYCGCRRTPQYLAPSRWHDWSVSTGVSRLLVTLNDRARDRLFLAACRISGGCRRGVT